MKNYKLFIHSYLSLLLLEIITKFSMEGFGNFSFLLLLWLFFPALILYLTSIVIKKNWIYISLLTFITLLYLGNIGYYQVYDFVLSLNILKLSPGATDYSLYGLEVIISILPYIIIGSIPIALDITPFHLLDI